MSVLPKYDFVISFGQKPNIKNKVYIETTARDGESSIDTDFDIEYLRNMFVKNGIPSKISHNAGTSYCNSIYRSGLCYIAEHKLKAKMVFLHVPFAKNIEDMDLFRKGIFETISELVK